MTILGTSPLSSNRLVQTLVVDDESLIRGPLSLCLETLGHQVVEAGTVDEAIACAQHHHLDIALVDLRLGTASGLDLMTRLLAVQPRLKIIIITAYGSVEVAVRAMARGAVDFLCKPFTPEQVAVAVARAAALRDLEADVGIVPDRWGSAGPEADFATSSSALQEAILTARRMAATDIPILIAGEPGTGKSILARAIHAWSRRPEGPFITFDCSLHSAAYGDLSLFGDAASGERLVARRDPPLPLQAAGGTLLIKKIECLSPRSQERLVRLLETRTLDLAETSAPVPCDCRVVPTSAGTGGPLLPALSLLLERVRVTLPPLRQRADDVPMLAQRYLSFARQNSEKQVFGFSVDAIDRLVSYDWPDNLRELHKAVQTAFEAASSAYVQLAGLPTAARAAAIRTRPRAGDAISLRDLEAAHIRELLARRLPLQEIADILGLDLQALYRRRRQYNLE